jgi:hypothetical protein
MWILKISIKTGQVGGGGGAENVIKINPCKCKEVSFTRARVKDSLNYALGYQLIQ